VKRGALSLALVRRGRPVLSEHMGSGESKDVDPGPARTTSPVTAESSGPKTEDPRPKTPKTKDLRPETRDPRRPETGDPL